MASPIDQEVLGLKISMDVAKLMEGIDGAEHLGDIESSMAVGKHTSVVEQGSKISTRDIFLRACQPYAKTIDSVTYHRQVNALLILKGIQQAHKSLALCVGQDITLGENVSDLVQLEQQLLAHNLQRTHLSGVLFLGEEDLTIPTLSNLRKNLKVSLSETDSALSKVGSLSANIFLPDRIVCFFWCSWGCGIFGFEVSESGLASANICQEVKIIVEEICRLSAKRSNQQRHLAYRAV